MKKFIRTLLLFLLPLILVWGMELVLPQDFFCYRSWEVLRYSQTYPQQGPFHSNATLAMEEVGDLAHHTAFQIKKTTHWKTDDNGFRNDSIPSNPDVIFIGDSFVAGSGLSQEETIASQLKERIGKSVSVYSTAPTSFNGYDSLVRSGLVKHPKVLVFSVVERNVPVPYSKKPIIEGAKKWLYGLLFALRLDVAIERCTRMYSLFWIKSRVANKKGKGIVSPIDSTQFFYAGKKVKAHGKASIDKAVAALLTYQRYCDSLGIKFVYMPMPNKETVYAELIPLQTPTYLNELSDTLTKAGIVHVPTQSLYANYRTISKELLYHKDDTHWNAKGVSLVAEYLSKLPYFQSLKR